MTQTLTATDHTLVFCDAEYSGKTWLFAPLEMFLRTKRLDRAGSELLIGRVGIEFDKGRFVGLRAPSFRRYPVGVDGRVALTSTGGIDDLRSAVRDARLIDQEAVRRGAVGINCAILRRRLIRDRYWQPAPEVRKAFLQRAIEVTACPQPRRAREEWFVD